MPTKTCVGAARFVRMHAGHIDQEAVKLLYDASHRPDCVILYGMDPAEFAKIVRTRLEEIGQSPYRAAVSHKLPRDAIRYVLSGRMPRLDRVAQICEALGLEFYVGPPRPPPQKGTSPRTAVPASRLVHPTHELVRLVFEAGQDPIPDDLWPELLEYYRTREPK